MEKIREMLMINNGLKQEITKKLTRNIKPYRIILFGSFARAEFNENSDIDLLVVLDTNKMPENFRERSQNYLSVSRLLRDIEEEIPLDLLVFTKPEFEKFISLDSLFSKEIIKKGEVLI